MRSETRGSRRALVLAVTIQLVLAAIRAPLGCTGCTTFGCTMYQRMPVYSSSSRCMNCISECFWYCVLVRKPLSVVSEVDNGLDVTATPECFDDEEGAAQAAPLRLLVGKQGDEILTCGDIVPYGQSRLQAYVKDVAKLCPIASCKYNSAMPACRISCACRLADAALT